MFVHACYDVGELFYYRGLWRGIRVKGERAGFKKFLLPIESLTCGMRPLQSKFMVIKVFESDLILSIMWKRIKLLNCFFSEIGLETQKVNLLFLN